MIRPRPVERDEADFVVVGTGAGGATAARVLSAAGHRVVLLEEGPDRRLGAQPPALLHTVRHAMRYGGQLVAEGAAAMTLLQGRVVGGSTAINSGIVWRLPDPVRAAWARDAGLADLLGRELDDAFDVIERELGVDETAAPVLGGNGRALRDGAEALGVEALPTRRNAPGCRGAARCLQGCPNRAKQSMDVSYVPRALADGARLHARWRAERVRTEGGRAVAVLGRRLDDADDRPLGRFEVRARRGVILSAGALFTPLILRRSGIRRHAGARFQGHPGAAVIGRMPEPAGMGQGATQSYQVLDPAGRFKIESLTLPPEMLASRLPGAGDAWQRRLGELDHYLQWGAVVRMEAVGRVLPGPSGVPRVRYGPTARDLEVTRRALALTARLMFAAGAVEVIPGVWGRPQVLRHPDEVRLIEEGPLRPKDLHLMSSHLMGGACADGDPSRGAVGPDLQSHAVPGLYVMDGSAFPTNIGVNPQHTIMGLSWVAAARLAQ